MSGLDHAAIAEYNRGVERSRRAYYGAQAHSDECDCGPCRDRARKRENSRNYMRKKRKEQKK